MEHSMKEDTLRRFFNSEVDVGRLADEVSRSVVRLNEIDSDVAIEDMKDDFRLNRAHVLSLCNAGIMGQLGENALTIIAFALIASDRIEWDDEIISETLYDWSCPEINLPLTPDILNMHQRWLVGTEQPTPKPALTPASGQGQVILRRRKVCS
jgi:hypothetical protein